jgi:hypothetical protein
MKSGVPDQAIHCCVGHKMLLLEQLQDSHNETSFFCVKDLADCRSGGLDSILRKRQLRFNNASESALSGKVAACVAPEKR